MSDSIVRSVTIKLLLLLLFLVSGSAALAGGGDQALLDSLLSTAAGEPTLQEIFDSLGYDIDVAADELGLTEIAASGGGNVAVLLQKLSSSYGSSVAGFHVSTDSTQKTQLFSPSNEVNDSVTFSVDGGSSIGLYFIPGISGGYTWYTEPTYNRDLYDHAKVFATGQNENEYLVCFEDLKNGGDRDFNDLIILIRTGCDGPIIQVPDDMVFNVCTPEEVCFDIFVSGSSCSGDSLEVKMIAGAGDFPIVNIVDSATIHHCFDPAPFDELYEFIFRVEDNLGNVVYGTFTIDYQINSPPEIFVPEDFDTVVCSSDSICFTVDAYDDDGDELQFELVEGLGRIDPLTGEVCFLPGSEGSADYRFVIRAKDDCCLSRSGECSSDPLCPYWCPLDTVDITVIIAQTPSIIYVPDIDTFLCEPVEICFPIEISNPGGGEFTVEVTPPATYNPATGEVCIYADADGTYEIEIALWDDYCGLSDVDTSLVTIDLNAPPSVQLPDDTTYFMCDLTEICFIAQASDPDGEPVTISLDSGPGQIDGGTGEVCFTPTGAGSYTFIVSVKDSCESMDYDTIQIDIELNSPPVVIAPDTSLFVCDLSEVCFEVSTYDPDPNDVLTLELVSGPGSLDPQTGEICFTPAAEGDYEFVVKVTDLCNEYDYDTATVSIVLNSDPNITLPEADTLSWCDLGDSVCFVIEVDDPDIGQSFIYEQIAGLPGNIDFETGMFCFLPDTAGTYIFEFKVTDECGATDQAQTSVTIRLNGNPTVDLPDDFIDSLCAVGEVCFPVMIYDDGEVVVDVTPIGYYENGEVCFPATKDTTYCLTVRATDICGAYDEDQICVTVYVNEPPSLDVEPDFTAVACEPGDTVCFSYTVTDPDGEEPVVDLMVGNGFLNDEEVCFVADTAGSYYFIVRATDACGEYEADDIFVTVVFNNPPELDAANDTTWLLCSPEQICFENPYSDPDPMDVLLFELISGSGIVFPENGMICFTPPAAGLYEFIIRVQDECGASDTDTVGITVVLNSAPSIAAEDTTIDVLYCGPDATPEELCFVGITIDDPDVTDVLTVTQTCGPGTFDPGTLMTCFTPVLKDTTYEFCYRVTDLCGAYDDVSMLLTIRPVDICDTASCMTIRIDETENCVYNGSEVVLDVIGDFQEGVGGFDLLVQFDVTAFTFLGANIGAGATGWEYFTYRYLGDGDCGGGPCPDGVVRMVGIADINNGASHPPPDAFWPDGVIAQLHFRTTDDVNFGGMFFPVKFYWLDCGDNGFSSISGDTFFVDKLILDHNGVVWDEFDDVNYPESARYPNVGAPDTCLVGGKTAPLRCVIFNNGGICIISPDSIDLRGDMNLNNVANEIADGVLYTNYFIWGMSVFTINPPGQIAASDVNADGNTLTVGDLVYLIRILTGDAQPIPKLAHFADQIDIGITKNADSYQISSDSRTTIGGGYFVFDFDPDRITPGAPILQGDASSMEVMYSIDGDQMKILIYSFTTNRIAAGDNILLNIPVAGDGELRLVHSDFADYYGNQLTVNQRTAGVMPGRFSLSQNYPNPFNPETEFDMYLPEASEWRVDILNVQGQLVRTMSGYAEAGLVVIKWFGDNDGGTRVASGIYFYKATAGQYSEIRKMVLLK